MMTPSAPFLKRSEDEGQIHPAGAHHADDPDLRRVTLSGNSRQVRSGVRSPVAEEGDNPRRVLKCRHLPPPSSRYDHSVADERRVDLVEDLLVGEVLEDDGVGRTLRAAQTIPLAEDGVHHGLLALRRLTELDGAVRTGCDARPARDAVLFDLADRPGGGDRLVREKRDRPAGGAVRLD